VVKRRIRFNVYCLRLDLLFIFQPVNAGGGTDPEALCSPLHAAATEDIAPSVAAVVQRMTNLGFGAFLPLMQISTQEEDSPSLSWTAERQ